MSGVQFSSPARSVGLQPNRPDRKNTRTDNEDDATAPLRAMAGGRSDPPELPETLLHLGALRRFAGTARNGTGMDTSSAPTLLADRRRLNQLRTAPPERRPTARPTVSLADVVSIAGTAVVPLALDSPKVQANNRRYLPAALRFSTGPRANRYGCSSRTAALSSTRPRRPKARLGACPPAAG
jgi:hypothetical protein